MTEITSNTTLDLLVQKLHETFFCYVKNVCVIDGSLIIIYLID